MSKPKINRAEITSLLASRNIAIGREKVILIGIRGYYRDSMGAKGKNDIGIYDDAFAWIDEIDFATFNGNTDPSRYYKRVATLRPGVWKYKLGLHGYNRKTPPYPAFRQAGDVVVDRYVDGKAWEADRGQFAINIHKGKPASTSSAGCQTVPPEQWDAFKEYGYMLMKRHGLKTFTYLLVDNDGSFARGESTV